VRQIVPPDRCPREALVASPATRDYQLVGYAVRPRPVLYVEDDYTREQYQRLLAALPGCWLLVRAGSPLVENLRVAASALEATLPGLDGEALQLYRLR
jgi:hypothetical protein